MFRIEYTFFAFVKLSILKAKIRLTKKKTENNHLGFIVERILEFIPEKVEQNTIPRFAFFFISQQHQNTYNSKLYLTSIITFRVYIKFQNESLFYFTKSQSSNNLIKDYCRDE